MSGTLAFRLTIRNPADDGDLVVIDSAASATNPYLIAAPEGDGTSIDILTGQTGVGAYEFRVADVSGTILDPSSTSRVVTGILADTAARWRLMGCKAKAEISVDGGGYASWVTGYVTEATLAGAMEWVIRVGEFDRREKQAQAFQGEFGSFFATRLIGGPPDFGPQQSAPFDYWLFEVLDTGDTSGNLPDDGVVLEFIEGWMYEKTSGNEGIVLMEGEISNETRNVVNGIASGYATLDAAGLVTFPGLGISVDDTSGNDVGTFTPYGYSAKMGPSSEAHISVGKGDRLIIADRKIALQWTGTLPSVGTTYRITGAPTLINEDNPLHFTGHIVDFVTEIYDEAGVEYDSTSAASVKASLGSMLCEFRFDKAEAVADVVRRVAFGPFGFAVRPLATGSREFFLTRQPPESAPSVTVTASDLLDPGHVVFRQSEDSIVTQVRYQLTTWRLWTEDEDKSDQPADGVVGTDFPLTVIEEGTIPDSAGVREQVYELPGWARGAGAGNGPSVSKLALFENDAAETLRRFGRGAPECELFVIRGSDAMDAALGDYVTVTLDHQVVPETGQTPTAQRGGSRILQVIQKTEEPQGARLTLLDFGPADAAPGTAPTFTLAQGTDTRHIATYTITNSGSLTGMVVRIEMAIDAEPSGNGTLVDVVTPSATTTNLPSVPAGSTVYVRMRAEHEDGGIAGSWTAWASVALDAIPAVTLLANAAGANDTERLITWTVGDANLRVRVRWKLTAASDYTSSVTLAPGSTQYTVTGLTPGSGYTVAVDHLDAPQFGGDGPDETTSWTAGSTTPTLTAPSDPAGHTDGAGVYGIDVTAYQPEMPSRVEVQIAVETSAGSGTYGSYATDGSVESVSPGRTRYSTSAPNDGLKRKLKARHTKTGYTESAYTAEVIVDPWGEVTQPGSSIDQSTDSVMIWQAGEGESQELDGIGEGRLAIQYSLDGSTGFGFVDGVSGPYVTLSLTGARKGDWAEPEAAAKAEVCYRLVTVDDASVVTALTGWRLWKNAEAVNYIRVGAEVSVAGSFSTDPVILNAWMETAATADTVPAPPDPDPPDDVTDPGPPEDTYPVARGLLFWGICDKGTFENDGTGLNNVAQIDDLSGSANHLGGDADISGATVKCLTRADGGAIAPLNGRQPINFRDAWLPFPTDMFDGVTEGEMFAVIRADNGDPAALNDRNYFHQLGPSDDARLAESTGGGADSGRIREDFGSTVLHDTGDFPGTLDEWFIYNVRAGSNHYRIYKVTTAGGTELAYTSDTNTVSFSTAPKLGNRGQNSDYLMAEYAIHSVITTTEERALIFAALLARWGI